MLPLKRAAVPWPFAKPATPVGEPASVVSMPAGDSWRIALLPVSETKTHPLLFAARPWGFFSLDTPGAPSMSPITPLPARVATVEFPAHSTRTAQLPQSAIKIFPAPSSPSAAAPAKRALAAGPSINPLTPSPARSLTTPPGVTSRSRFPLVSAIIAKPVALTKSPAGLLNRALLPMPLAYPAEAPASVVTRPPLSARRV